MNIYQQRRNQLAKNMAPNSLLILAGNGELERTADTTYPFRQSNNFLYLTGISQPDAILVIQKSQDEIISHQLYIPQLHPFMAIWEGRTNQLQELSDRSGIDTVEEYTQREELLSTLLTYEPRVIYLDMPDNTNAQIAAWQLWSIVKDLAPDLDLAAINVEISSMRVIKSDEEIMHTRKAIHITHQAIAHTRQMLHPGITERAVAAEFIRFCSEKGYEQAFPPIISFSRNTCIIHHQPDDTKLHEGDLVLFDVGVEVAGYAADISRTFSTGVLSERQQQVLDAVTSVQEDAIKLMKPGIAFDEFERQAAQIMAKKLVEIGLFDSLEQANELEGDMQWPAYRRYFNHMTSHFLGLDAHDVGSREAVFEPGMVLTCEPGIYIAEEGIGVRIEDDVLITAQGNRVLSAEPDHQ